MKTMTMLWGKADIGIQSWGTHLFMTAHLKNFCRGMSKDLHGVLKRIKQLLHSSPLRKALKKQMLQFPWESKETNMSLDSGR
jgi:hypothetical protein